MRIETCDICGKPTGRAGRNDDSLVCPYCDSVICEECMAIEDREGNPVCATCSEFAIELLDNYIREKRERKI